MNEQELIDALQDQDNYKFRRLVTGNFDFLQTAKQFPQHADALIQKVLTSDAEFTRLVKDNFDFLQTAKQFPQHADALIQKVLSDPKYFDALIRTDDDLLNIKPFCPNIKAIQNATSRADARARIKEQVIRQGREARFTAFFRSQPQMQGMGDLINDLAETHSGTVEEQLKEDEKPPKPPKPK